MKTRILIIALALVFVSTLAVAGPPPWAKAKSQPGDVPAPDAVWAELCDGLYTVTWETDCDYPGTKFSREKTPISGILGTLSNIRISGFRSWHPSCFSGRNCQYQRNREARPMTGQTKETPLPPGVKRELKNELWDDRTGSALMQTVPRALIFTVTGNWQRIFRQIKWLGLIYSIRRSAEQYEVKVDGPISLFKLNRRYGTSLAKLFPFILQSQEWSVNAKILNRRGERRLLNLELASQKQGKYFQSIRAI